MTDPLSYRSLSANVQTSIRSGNVLPELFTQSPYPIAHSIFSGLRNDSLVVCNATACASSESSSARSRLLPRKLALTLITAPDEDDLMNAIGRLNDLGEQMAAKQEN
ncbi:MAG: hypothetical protein R6V43_13330 [Halopseudomonas sp.]